MKKLVIVCLLFCVSTLFAGYDENTEGAVEKNSGGSTEEHVAIKYHEEFVQRIMQLPHFFWNNIIPVQKMQTKVLNSKEYWNMQVTLNANIKYIFIASSSHASSDVDLLLTDFTTNTTVARDYGTSADTSVSWQPFRDGKYLISIHYYSGNIPTTVAYRGYKLMKK